MLVRFMIGNSSLEPKIQTLIKRRISAFCHSRGFEPSYVDNHVEINAEGIDLTNAKQFTNDLVAAISDKGEGDL